MDSDHDGSENRMGNGIRIQNREVANEIHRILEDDDPAYCTIEILNEVNHDHITIWTVLAVLLYQDQINCKSDNGELVWWPVNR